MGDRRLSARRQSRNLQNHLLLLQHPGLILRPRYSEKYDSYTKSVLQYEIA
jgi:hypothetical protein